MEHLRIIRDIEMKNFKPVYLLMGEEPYFIDQVSDYIEDKVLDESSKAFGQTVVYGRDTSMEQVVSLSKSFPMMGDRQVVIVKEAQEMKDWKKEEDYEVLINYLKNPLQSTMLVFAYKHKSLDKRTKIWKQFQKSAVVFEAEKIKEAKLPDWIMNYVQHSGLRISSTSASLLAEYLGTDLGKVVNEVGKLAVVLKPGEEITPQVIEEHIGISKDYNVWELQKVLGRKDVMRSNRIISYFEANPKSNPIQMVIPSLYGYFSKLAAYQHAVKEKKDPIKEVGLNPYALNDYKEAARNYTTGKVERIIGYLRETDGKSKGINNPSVEDGELMKELVFKILH